MIRNALIEHQQQKGQGAIPGSITLGYDHHRHHDRPVPARMNTHGAAWTGTVLLLAVAMAQAARPLAVGDADPVGPGEVELEAGVGYVADGNTHHGDFTVGLTVGIWPRVKLGVGTGGQLEEREEVAERRTATDWGDVTIGAKVKLLEAACWWADQAVAFTVKLPTASHHKDSGPAGRTTI